MTLLRYATYEGDPCVFTDTKAWLYYKGWRPIRHCDACCWAGLISYETFVKHFRYALPLPPEARAGDQR